MIANGVKKKFNVTGLCVPGRHYMVDTSEKIERIVHDYIEQGEYFTINRARQYGKTTTFSLLEKRMQDSYTVIRMSFEGKESFFNSFDSFCKNMSLSLINILKEKDTALAAVWENPIGQETPELDFRNRISETCRASGKPVVLMIDEVDRATGFGVFITFLGILRDMYLERGDKGTLAFHSVILAGVHDIKNLKKKIRPDSEHAYNSPWNIAADFNLDMSFSPPEIATMLDEYENDHHTKMDIPSVADRIHYYTGGYPFLVSKLCKMIDENDLGFTPGSVDDAVKELVKERNTLFEDLSKNVLNNQELGDMVREILLRGKDVQFSIYNPAIDLGFMYGIITKKGGKIALSNIIFEKILYDLFLSLEDTRGKLKRANEDSSLFIKNGRLDMDTVAARFAFFMKSEYRDEDGDFIENHARLLFLSFLMPIINGAGHYAVEPQTRNNRRMDIVVFFGKEKFIIELKIWRGQQYEESGYAQLADYLDSQGQKKGWLISFSGNKKSPGACSVFEHKGLEIAETVIAYRDKSENL